MDKDNMSDSFERYSEYFANDFNIDDLGSLLTVVKKQREILHSIASMYVVMYLANLETDSFIEIWCMDHVKRLFGNERSTKAVLNLVVEHFVAPDFREAARAFNDTDTLAERLKGKNVISIDYDATIAGWCRQQFIPVSWDENGLAKEVICTEQRIQAEKMKVDTLRKLAETDGLTQLFNRTSGANYIDKYLEEDRQGLFCLLDVDNFKHFNDEYGHAAGDEILKTISRCMHETFRAGDVMMRIGGDEFGIYAPGIVEMEFGNNRINDLLQRIENQTFEHFKETVTVSAGIVLSDSHELNNFDELFKAADPLMYENKRANKSKNQG